MRRLRMSQKEFNLLLDQKVGLCSRCLVLQWVNIESNKGTYECHVCDLGFINGMILAFDKNLIEILDHDCIFV